MYPESFLETNFSRGFGEWGEGGGGAGSCDTPRQSYGGDQTTKVMEAPKI